MLGGEKDEGLVLQVAQHLISETYSSSGKLSMSFVQIYGKEITDLLSETTSSRLGIRDNGEEVYVEGLSRWDVNCLESLHTLLEIGAKKRVIANTKLNATSSRSHALITFYYENASGEVGAKLHMVDLAGSERVKDSGVSGKSLKEACQINLSLFHLARVVKSLEKKTSTTSGSEIIPYKDDVLCHLLKDSLCGGSAMCRTTLLAMVSPSQEHAFETSSTLKFAIGCSRIQLKQFQQNKKNGSSSKPWHKASKVSSLSELKKEEAENEANNAKLLPWANIKIGSSDQCVGGRVTLPLHGLQDHSSVSTMIYYSAVNDDRESKVAVLLHGYPSDSQASYGSWLISALIYGGFVVLAIDMPGCGGSDGPSFKSTRSEHALDAGGPAEVIVEAINSLATFDYSIFGVRSKYPRTNKWGGSKVVLIGSDWGGGIALMMGGSRRHKAGISHIVAHLPSFQEKKIAQLINTPTLLLWSKDDQFHSYSAFLPVIKSLKQSLSNGGSTNLSYGNGSLDKKKYFTDLGGIKVFGDYQEYIVSKKNDPKWSYAGKERCIMRFLTDIEYLPEAQTIKTRPKVHAVSTEGLKMSANLNIVFRPAKRQSGAEETDGDGSGSFERELIQQQRQQSMSTDESNAVVGLKRMIERNTLESTLIAMTMGATSSSTTDINEAKKVFARLPVLEPSAVTASQLVRFGLWSRKAEQACTKLLHQCGSYPRFNTNAGNIVICPSGEFAKLIEVNELQDKVIVESFSDNREACVVRHSFPMKDLLLMNQRHIFPFSNQKLVLEDGITCNHRNSLTRAKMCQIALSLGPVFEEIGSCFDKGMHIESEVVELLRHECIHTIRKCVNITTFQRGAGIGGGIAGGDRGRDRDRYCKDDVGKFACYGEGHCHTVSSVMAACLLPFCDSILGVDLLYREDVGGHHQWLEYTLLSHKMKRFTCDLYREDGRLKSKQVKLGNGFTNKILDSYLSMPIEKVYKRWGSSPGCVCLQPAPSLKVLSGKALKTAPIENGDLE